MASRKEVGAAAAAQLAELRATWEEARRIAQLDPTVENRNRAKAAWVALGTASPPMKKSGGFASRAGQRQAAERRAEQAERERRGRSHATIKKSARQLDREIAQALTHSTKKTAPSASGRWVHRSVARSLNVPEDVVRRIYASVQTAKRQGLYGGYMADLSERDVGRKLVGAEYAVYARAKEHLGYDPPGGYGGPQPKGSAKEPQRARYDDPKIRQASQLAESAESTIKGVLSRWKFMFAGRNEAKDRVLLQRAADELDVAADLYEEAGAGVRAGTLHERAKYARQGDYTVLVAYD